MIKFHIFLCRYSVNIGSRYIVVQIGIPYNIWTHVALVYKGSDDGEGLTAYKNGIRQVDNTAWSNGGSFGESGEVMIGRLFNRPTGGNYGRCQVDELLIWNIELYDYDIKKIYDSYLNSSTNDVK